MRIIFKNKKSNKCFLVMIENIFEQKQDDFVVYVKR